ncbi:MULTISPECIES: hypothetical protein [Actinosynnema]|uniref:hypothetical protein n=1 Tax=Actinosynnema TaxID=40566 RepID=UPI0020A3A597|nr:hypothetical protein [Actinosynnema pretiosum]MCP2097165.1 hypothetical protein [Actinosynnema pretiosum]
MPTTQTASTWLYLEEGRPVVCRPDSPDRASLMILGPVEVTLEMPTTMLQACRDALDEALRALEEGEPEA